MSAIDEEEVKNLLDTILKTIQTEADPYLLNQYRALIRKNVSFFKRSYLAAYLLMLRDQSQGRHRKPGGDRPRGRPNARNSANNAEPGGGAEPSRRSQRPAQQNPAPVALPEDEATQLFINIGRSRWVFPREILGLIAMKTSIPKEDIGRITILNNYSFVQVRNSAAAEMLESLNGVNFRGKTLAVNYARTRKEANEKGDDPAFKPERPHPGSTETGASGPGAYAPADTADPIEQSGSADPGGSVDTDNPLETGGSLNPDRSEDTGNPTEAGSSANPDGSVDTDNPLETRGSPNSDRSEDAGDSNDSLNPSDSVDTSDSEKTAT